MWNPVRLSLGVEHEGGPGAMEASVFTRPWATALLLSFRFLPLARCPAFPSGRRQGIRHAAKYVPAHRPR